MFFTLVRLVVSLYFAFQFSIDVFKYADTGRKTLLIDSFIDALFFLVFTSVL